MKTTTLSSRISAWMISMIIGFFMLLNATTVQACMVQYLGSNNQIIYYSTVNSSPACIALAVSMASEAGIEVKVVAVINVITGQVVYIQMNDKNMKAINNQTVLSAEDAAKLPGLAKYKPFRGNDDVQISVGANTLIFHGNEGTASENPLDVCQSEGSQQCKNPNTWVVTKDDKASNDAYQIQPSNDKKAYLCFNGPDGGISVRRKPTKTDQCINWTIVPGQIGKDGEITGYKIYPTKHPEYVLAVDTRSNQVRVDKVNTKAEEAGEPDKSVLTNWTFTTAKSKRPVTNQPKVVKEAEQK